MNAALRYLAARSFINGFTARLKRLRQPKYLIGAILGGAYFYFYFYKFLFRGGQPTAPGPQLITDAVWPTAGAAILLIVTLVLSWILPGSRAAMAFTEAEIAFLFPAPISRRLLVIHKLLKSQLTFLFLAVIITFLTGRFRAGGDVWFRTAGWWVIFNTLNMHRIGASFALQRLRERGMADGKRRVALVLAVGALAALIEATRRSLPELPPMIDAKGKPFTDVSGLIQQITSAGPLPYLLMPFRWVVGPYFSHDAGSFLLALGPALGIMLLHFVWVVRADVSFEEASIVASQKQAAAIAAHREGKLRIKSLKARTPVWRLRPTGFPPFAFLWKALIKFGGRRALMVWSTFFLVLVAGVWYIHSQIWQGTKPPTWVIVSAFIVGGGCYLTILLSLVMVGQSASAQLRQGMASMDLIKGYPIPGWHLALGELIGPILLGTLLQWGAISIGAFLAFSVARTGAGVITTIAACLAVVLPAFNITMSVLPCAGALIFPGWFKPQDGAAPGIEGTGLRLIVGIAQLAALAVMLVPVGFYGSCVWFLAEDFGLSFVWRAVAAGGVGAIVLVMEAALGVEWLGYLYDKYDTSAA
jgi:hypothetical protein